MQINADPSKQKCEGIISATSAAGADVGGKVTDMMNQLTEMLLAKSVVGEKHEIDTDNIKIFATMASGEDAKEQFSILDTGVSVDLPDDFCLEKQETIRSFYYSHVDKSVIKHNRCRKFSQNKNQSYRKYEELLQIYFLAN